MRMGVGNGYGYGYDCGLLSTVMRLILNIKVEAWIIDLYILLQLQAFLTVIIPRIGLDWIGLDSLSGTDVAIFLSDPSPIVALPCRQVIMPLHAFVET